MPLAAPLLRRLFALATLGLLAAASAAFARPLPALDAATSARLDAALPTTAATPAKPRRLLIYTRSDYDGHDLAIATANEGRTEDVIP
jgi:hypothetical protein